MKKKLKIFTIELTKDFCIPHPYGGEFKHDKGERLELDEPYNFIIYEDDEHFNEEYRGANVCWGQDCTYVIPHDSFKIVEVKELK